MPEGAPVAVAADAAVLPLDVRQHVDARARSRARPQRAFYYITDVDPSWPAERQDEHLRDFNYGALWAISIHEVFPGHFLHYQHLRQVDVEAAQVDPVLVDRVRRRLGALLRADDGRGGLPQAATTTIRLGQLAEALVRLCRIVVGIRLHCEDMSVEQGVRFFRDEAFLEEASARREAERGTFDPAYILYSAGKLMLLKLREDYKAHAGAQVLAARRSTTRCSPTAPCRSVAAPGAAARRAERRDDRVGVDLCLCTSTSATPAPTASSASRSSPTRRSTSARSAAGTVRKLLSSPAIQFKGIGLVHHRLRRRSRRPTSGKGESAKADGEVVGRKSSTSESESTTATKSETKAESKIRVGESSRPSPSRSRTRSRRKTESK